MSASIELATRSLEAWIAECLEYPAAFPYVLNGPVVSIREMRNLRITPAMWAEYPPVDIEATMRGRLVAYIRNLPGQAGPRRLDVDFQLLARGTVRGDGSYDVAPHSARVQAWWQGIDPVP